MSALMATPLRRTSRLHSRLLSLLLLAAAAAVFLRSIGGVTQTCFVSGLPSRFSASLRGCQGERTHRTVRMQAPTDVSVKKDDKMQVLYEGTWYDSTILSASADGSSCSAKYDDGEDVEEDIDVATRIRPIPPPMKVEKGKKMEVFHEGVWYDCEILSVSDDGEACAVKYDDGGDEEEDVYIVERIRAPRIKFSALEVGQKFKGEVKSIAGFGVFVDIGAERDGLVHISRIANERVENVEDYVEMGQMIDVWVSQILDDGKLGLSMIEGKIGAGGGPRAPADLSKFVDVSPDEWLDGTVARTAHFGAFVSVTPPDGSAPQDGLVHISQLRDGFVDNVDDEVEIGQQIKVRIVRVDEGAGKLSLSMKEGGGFGGGAPRAPADLTPFESLSPDEWITGKVARIAPFGIFVTATNGEASADGLVHITQIRDGFVENAEDEAEIGQEVKIRVLSVDSGAGKMSLSMKEDSDF